MLPSGRPARGLAMKIFFDGHMKCKIGAKQPKENYANNNNSVYDRQLCLFQISILTKRAD